MMLRNRMIPTIRRDATRVLAVLAALLLLAGCGHADFPPTITPPTLPPPTPAGMEVLPPEPAPTVAKPTCDLTASLSPYRDRPAADAAAKKIRDRGRLIVGLDVGTNLLSFRDPITGEINGFDVDIAAEVARDIFGSPLQLEYRILSSAERISALQEQKVDIVVKTMSITCQRRTEVNFSTVYLTAHQRILIPRDSAIMDASGLSGKRVCAARGTTSLDRVREITPPATVVAVINWADCLVALQQRQVDAISTDDVILAGLISQDPYLSIVGPYMTEEPYGIGVNLGNPGLVRVVNATLERIRRDGTWTRLWQKWFSALGPAPAPPVPRYSD